MTPEQVLEQLKEILVSGNQQGAIELLKNYQSTKYKQGEKHRLYISKFR